MLYDVAQQAMPSWVMPLLDISLGGFLIMSFFWTLKWMYSRDFKPTKKHRHGQLICTYHPENKRPYSVVLPIEDNGRQVRAASNKHPSKTILYEFDGEAIEYIKYPAAPFMGITLLQGDAPRVSWWENDPNPIKKSIIKGYQKDKTGKLIEQKDIVGYEWDEDDKIKLDSTGEKIPIYSSRLFPIYEPIKPLITAERIDMITDDSTIEAGNILEDEMAKQQAELRKALSTRLNPVYIYMLLIAVLIGSATAAYFGFQIFKMIQARGGL